MQKCKYKFCEEFPEEWICIKRGENPLQDLCVYAIHIIEYGKQTDVKQHY